MAGKGNGRMKWRMFCSKFWLIPLMNILYGI
ncbi:hypothetical protein VTO73DRAFT_9865 [Trametes versicolor]